MKIPTTLSLLTALLALSARTPLFAQTGDSAEGLPLLRPFRAAAITPDSIPNDALPRLKTFDAKVIAAVPTPEPAPATTLPSLKPAPKLKLPEPIGSPVGLYLSMETGVGWGGGASVRDEQKGYDFEEEDGQSGSVVNARCGFGLFGADTGRGFIFGLGVGTRYMFFGRNGSNQPVSHFGYMQKQRVHYIAYFDICLQLGFRRFILDTSVGYGKIFANEKIGLNGESIDFAAKRMGYNLSIGADWKITNKFALGLSYSYVSTVAPDFTAEPNRSSRYEFHVDCLMAGVRFYLGSW